MGSEMGSEMGSATIYDTIYPCHAYKEWILEEKYIMC
jgi:hypothetical protein